MAMSTSIHWIACRLAIGSPKVTRVLACSVESAMSFSMAPSAQAAMVRRRWSSTVIAILNPSPSRPSRFSRGTSQSSNTSSTVCEPRKPIFFSIVPTDTPGKPFSTANAEMPFGPFDLSVMAITVWTPAMSPLVMKCLTPLMTYVSPLSSAVVWRREASEPALGSVRAKEPMSRPAAISGRYFRFSSSLPPMRMAIEPMPLLVPMRVRKQAFVRDSSSLATHCATTGSPCPPYSSGMARPKRPMSAIFAATPSGIRSSSSTCSEIGSSSRSTNLLMVSRSASTSSGSVKSTASSFEARPVQSRRDGVYEIGVICGKCFRQARRRFENVPSGSAFLRARQRGAHVSHQREQARANLLFQEVDVQLKRGAAATEDDRLGLVRQGERNRDSVHLPPPVAEGDAEPTLLMVENGLIERLPQLRPLIGVRLAELVEELPLLRLGQPTEVGAPDRRGSDGNSRPDLDEERARVPVGIDEDHRQALSHGEVDRALDVLRETLHRLPRDAADVHLGHGDEAEPPRRAPERVVAVRVRVAEVAGLDERVRQPGDGRLREAGSHRDLLVGQPAVPRVETAQHLQAAPERGHIPV